MEKALDIRAIYAGAFGNASMGSIALGDLSGIAENAGKLQKSGAAGGSILDAISGVIGGTRLASGLFKKASSLGKRGVDAVKGIFGKTPKSALAVEEAVEGVDNAMRNVTKAVRAGEGIESIAGNTAKSLDAVETVAKPAGALSRISGSLATGAKFLGKAALPLTVITSSAEVLFEGRTVAEGSVTEKVDTGLEKMADRMENSGVLGKTAAALSAPTRNAVVIGSSIAEETINAASNATKTVFDPQASVLSKIGSVLDLAGGAEIRGALMGANHVIDRTIDRFFDAKIERDNAAYKSKLDGMIAERIQSMSPEGRARYEAAHGKAGEKAHESPKASKDGSLPFGLEVASTIPYAPARSREQVTHQLGSERAL